MCVHDGGFVRQYKIGFGGVGMLCMTSIAFVGT